MRNPRPGHPSAGSSRSLFSLRPGPVEQPGGSEAGFAPAGRHRCFRCDHFVVDEDADVCDWCLDAIEDELARRMIGIGW